MDELIDAVQRSLDAEQKVTDLNAMKKMQEYSSDDCQAKLEEWIARMKKSVIMQMIICRNSITATLGTAILT